MPEKDKSLSNLLLDDALSAVMADLPVVGYKEMNKLPSSALPSKTVSHETIRFTIDNTGAVLAINNGTVIPTGTTVTTTDNAVYFSNSLGTAMGNSSGTSFSPRFTVEELNKIHEGIKHLKETERKVKLQKAVDQIMAEVMREEPKVAYGYELVTEE